MPTLTGKLTKAERSAFNRQVWRELSVLRIAEWKEAKRQAERETARQVPPKPDLSGLNLAAMSAEQLRTIFGLDEADAEPEGDPESAAD